MNKAAGVLQHPATLAVSLGVGGLFGALVPGWGSAWSLLGGTYIALLNMAAIPLVVVAVLMGLRRLREMPQAAARLGTLVATSAAAMLACALLALGAALLWSAGGGLDANAVEALGRLAQREQDVTVVALHGTEALAVRAWAWPVPGNIFQALAYGPISAVLVGTLGFGLALAAQPKEASRALLEQLEAIYRTLEALIERLNGALPVLAFAMAADVASHASLAWLGVMGSFLLTLLSCVCVALVACGYIVGRLAGTGAWQALHALRRPLTVSLFAGGTAAAVPGMVEGLSSRLGLRRDLVEFAAPLLPVLVRVGEVVFFVLLAVFVARLYDVALGPAALWAICAGAVAAALASATLATGRFLAAAAAMLGALDMPVEALLPVFVLLEVVCEGLRNLLSVLVACAVVAIAARGLPVQVDADARPQSAAMPLRVVLSRGQAALAAAFAALALVGALLAGLGVGLQRGPVAAASSGSAR